MLTQHVQGGGGGGRQSNHLPPLLKGSKSSKFHVSLKGLLAEIYGKSQEVAIKISSEDLATQYLFLWYNLQHSMYPYLLAFLKIWFRNPFFQVARIMYQHSSTCFRWVCKKYDLFQCVSKFSHILRCEAQGLVCIEWTDRGSRYTILLYCTT